MKYPTQNCHAGSFATPGWGLQVISSLRICNQISILLALFHLSLDNFQKLLNPFMTTWKLCQERVNPGLCVEQFLDVVIEIVGVIEENLGKVS